MEQKTEISAIDFDMVCHAYQTKVGDIVLDDTAAYRYARELVHELTNEPDVDDALIVRILERTQRSKS